jgi:AcrR family transcriptional regulator
MSPISTRDHLIRTAATLFRQKGYSGVGLAEILAVAGLPKGSLYHHFPGGKRELAEAATLWVGKMIEKMVDRAFEDATDFQEGAIRTCQSVERLTVQEDQVLACPVMSMLQAVSQEPELRDVARTVLADWKSCLAGHAARLGMDDPDLEAEQLLVLLQGTWILALAEQSGAPFERLAERLSHHRQA